VRFVFAGELCSPLRICISGGRGQAKRRNGFAEGKKPSSFCEANGCEANGCERNGAKLPEWFCRRQKRELVHASVMVPPLRSISVYHTCRVRPPDVPWQYD